MCWSFYKLCSPIAPLSFFLYSTTHLLQIYSWPDVFEDHYSIQVRFLMPPISEKLHTVLPLLIAREGSAAAQRSPCAHHTSPFLLLSILPSRTAATELPQLRHVPKRLPPRSHKPWKVLQSTAGCRNTSPPPLGITALMCSWRVNSSLKIKILGTVTTWNCKITLDLFPLQIFFLFSPK